jgi:hypothetical protein
MANRAWDDLVVHGGLTSADGGISPYWLDDVQHYFHQIGDKHNVGILG